MASPTQFLKIRLIQNLIDCDWGQDIELITVHESSLTSEQLAVFDHPEPIGISPGYSTTGNLIALAISNDSNCLIVEFYNKVKRDSKGNGRSTPSRNYEGRKLLQDTLLCRSVGEIYAFELAPLALSLYCDVDTRITSGVDIQSAYSPTIRKPLHAIELAVGDTFPIFHDNIKTIFRDLLYDTDDRNHARDLAQRAWISQYLPQVDNTADFFGKVPKIDTKKLSFETLNVVAKVARDTFRLDQQKPLQVKHNFTSARDSSTGQFKAVSHSYNNKIRSGQDLRMSVQSSAGAAGYVVPGQTGMVLGKSAGIASSIGLEKKLVTSITTIGREDPTTAEAQRAATLRRILQGATDLLTENPWLQNLWFATEALVWPDSWKSKSRAAVASDGKLGRHRNLNNSQIHAIKAMLSPADQHHIVMIQGPPGTGKTSVIATFVEHAIGDGQRGIWLVAQSNVAVKNIAEKLAAIGFLDFRLLVSKDFQFEWHEHLYNKIRNNVIQSDEFNQVPRGSRLQGCQVILCTLSMLSNRFIGKISFSVPVISLIVDEASQIEIGDYIHVFSSFERTLRKVCFIGDDKQLPPFGQEELEDLQSIFEVNHLRKLALFLDTQYRMPPQVGDFISSLVYDNKLHSNPDHPITNKTIACRFIDVVGQEKFQSKSFMNEPECEVVLKIAAHLQEQGKSYRIITPYEAQRSNIESGMERMGLDRDDKCFNVDSFQGNEDDYIVISLVRSRELGFLKNLRRTNVMLTRCKRGMFIVTSQAFLKGAGAESLAGKLAEKMGPEAWLGLKDVEEGNF